MALRAARSSARTCRWSTRIPRRRSSRRFPACATFEVSPTVHGQFDAAIVMECGDLSRTGVEGFDKYFVINIDHHPGNKIYGAINWFDAGRGGLRRDGVRRHRGARRDADAGDRDAHLHRDSHRHGRLSFLAHHAAHVRDLPPLHRGRRAAGGHRARGVRQQHDGAAAADGRRAAQSRVRGRRPRGARRTDAEAARRKPAPRTKTPTASSISRSRVKEIQAVAFFKEIAPDSFRISLRSKGSVDVNRVASAFGGGGHKNAAGCS